MHYRLVIHNKTTLRLYYYDKPKVRVSNINKYHNNPLFGQFFGDKNEDKCYSKTPQDTLWELNEVDMLPKVRRRSPRGCQMDFHKRKMEMVWPGRARRHPWETKHGVNVP